MIAASSRGKSATLVALVCVLGAFVAGFVAREVSDQPEMVAFSAVIAGMTGLAAALATSLFSPSPQPASAAPSLAPISAHEPGRLRKPEQTGQGDPAPPHSTAVGDAEPGLVTESASPTHGSRSALAAPEGDPPTARLSQPRPESHIDPRLAALQAQYSALRNEYRTSLAQRAALLRGLAEMVGLLPEAYGWQVANLLKRAGVREVMPPPGTPFDPVLHQVLGTEPTPDQSAHDTVAHASRPGWLDRDHVLVPAHVVLYAFHAPPESARTDDQQ